MKNFKLINIAFVALLVMSCRGLDDVVVPEFNVTVEKTTFTLNEEVKFNFTGNPDIITLYSGVIGNDYSFANGRVLSNRFNMQFETQMLDGRQDDQLHILLSIDFSGEYALDAVQKATWVDITEKFTIPKPQQTRLYVNSNVGDFTDDIFGETGSQKFYVAIKHQVKDQNSFGLGNLNRIRGMRLFSNNLLGETLLYNHTSLAWNLLSTENKEADRAQITTTLVELRSNVKDKVAETEDWAISKELQISKETNAGPDRGDCIKSVGDGRVDNYTIKYNAVGEYRVVFIAKNINAESEKTIVKEMTINVVE